MLGAKYLFVARQRAVSSRAISSLSSNPSIKVVKSPKAPFTNYLSYLDKEPPNEHLVIGTTTQLPPTPQSFSENREFVKILDEVVSEYGHQDEDLINQARAFASPGGFNLGSGGSFSLKNDLIEADLASKVLEVLREATAQAAQAHREGPVVVDEEDMCISATEGTPQTLDG
ncbi:hypothetical protein SNK04_003301 [Fusarium graminearum]